MTLADNTKKTQKVQLRAETGDEMDKWKVFLDPILARSLQERLKPILTNSETHKVMAEDLTEFYEKHDQAQVKNVGEVIKQAYMDKL